MDYDQLFYAVSGNTYANILYEIRQRLIRDAQGPLKVFVRTGNTKMVLQKVPKARVHCKLLSTYP